MKKLAVLLLLSVMLFSCTLDDNENKYHYEFLPVESFEVPSSFDFGQIYTITVFYKRPNDCHTEQSLYFEKKDSTRTIAIQSLVVDKSICTLLPDEESHAGTFEFEVLSSTPYLFKFYKGKDENGADVFEEIIIPVAN
jgi:hypothetical protein